MSFCSRFDAFRALDRDLGKVVAEMFDFAVELAVLSRTQLKSFSRVPALMTSRYSSSPRRWTMTSSTNVPCG